MSSVIKTNLQPNLPAENSAAKAVDDKLHQVAELYENQFIREMIKQMRSTVQESDLIKKNNAEKIFSGQLDEQYADKWTQNGGIGLADLIYNQLIERYGEKMGLKSPTARPQGPLPFDHKSNFSGGRSVGSGAATDLASTTFKFMMPENEKTEVRNPWVGVLLDKKYLEMDQLQYRIKHDNGLESFILTRGTGLGGEQNLSVGDKLGAGQQLGWASAASPLFWTVKDSVSE